MQKTLTVLEQNLTTFSKVKKNKTEKFNIQII